MATALMPVASVALVLPRVSGNREPPAAALLTARFVPNSEASEPAATGPLEKLAALTTPLAMNDGTAATVNSKALEALPPGAGLETDTWAIPGAARSAAEIDVVTWFALTKVVLRLWPFQLTVAP